MAKYSLRADVVRSALQKRTSLGGSIFRGAYDPGDVPFAELEPLVQPVPKQLVPISIPAITGPASLLKMDTQSMNRISKIVWIRLLENARLRWKRNKAATLDEWLALAPANLEFAHLLYFLI
jgi:hypothetical protein